MRLLLDTHVLLWWVTDDRKLPRRCAAWIEDRSNDIAISPVSAYEIRFKALKGLLPHGETAIEAIGRVAEQAGFVPLPLNWAHALAAGVLPLPHRDPFDRLLAGQAIAEATRSSRRMPRSTPWAHRGSGRETVRLCLLNRYEGAGTAAAERSTPEELIFREG